MRITKLIKVGFRVVFFKGPFPSAEPLGLGFRGLGQTYKGSTSFSMYTCSSR